MGSVIIGKTPGYLRVRTVFKVPNGNDSGANTAEITSDLSTIHFTNDQPDRVSFWEYLEKCRPSLQLKGLFSRKDPTERKIKRLLHLLGNKNEDVQNKAACDLGDLIESDIPAGFKSKIVNSLIKALKDNNWHNRDGAALGLEYLTTCDISSELKEKMVNPLIEALGDENESVRSHIATALKNLVTHNIPPETSDISSATTDISLGSKKTIIDRFIKALKNDNWLIRDLATDAFGYLARYDINVGLKEKMVAPLIEALNDSDWHIKNGAAYALENLSRSNISKDYKESMIDPLIKTLRDKSNADIVRTHAVYAFENLVRSDISRESKMKMVYPLFEASTDRNKDIQDSAKRALNYLAESSIYVI